MIIWAPWTEDQIASLNAFQKSGRWHPFTGPRKDNGEETVLLATRDGWVTAAGDPVVQAWAYDWMADWGWKTKTEGKALELLLNFASLLADREGITPVKGWLNEAKSGAKHIDEDTRENIRACIALLLGE